MNLKSLFSTVYPNAINKIKKTALFIQPHRGIFLGNLFADLKISFLPE